jgi:hypothetical protein
LPLPVPIEDGFAIDTGCDFDLVLAGDLRDRLVAAGVPSSRATIQWGTKVASERFVVQAALGSNWRPAEAFFPLSPSVDENIVGLPLLRFEAVCIRPNAALTCLGRAVG